MLDNGRHAACELASFQSREDIERACLPEWAIESLAAYFELDPLVQSARTWKLSQRKSVNL